MSKTIPLVDLKAQYPTIKSEVEAVIAETIEQTAFILGPRVADFENEFAAFRLVGEAAAALAEAEPPAWAFFDDTANPLSSTALRARSGQ